MIGYVIQSQHYTFWILMLIITIFLLWVFIGGKTQEFVGLSPLKADQPISPYVKDIFKNPSMHNSSLNYSRLDPITPSYIKTSDDLWSETEILSDFLSTNEDPVVIDTT